MTAVSITFGSQDIRSYSPKRIDGFAYRSCSDTLNTSDAQASKLLYDLLEYYEETVRADRLGFLGSKPRKLPYQVRSRQHGVDRPAVPQLVQKREVFAIRFQTA